MNCTSTNTFEIEDGQQHESQKKGFRWKDQSLLYIEDMRNYKQHLSRQRLQLISIKEQAVHFWHLSIGLQDFLETGYYHVAAQYSRKLQEAPTS